VSESPDGKKGRTVNFSAFAAAFAAFIIMAVVAGYIFYNDSNNYRALQQGLDQQTATLTSLSGNYTALYNQYVALQADHANLQASYDDLTKIAALQKNQTVASGTVLHIPKNSFDSVEVQSSYAGYIHVQLSSTQAVFVTLTNYKYLTTIAYPVSGSQISSGSFNLPVLDGTNYLEIYSQVNYDATVTLTIILFY
jgi:hypothetical protein